MSEPDLEPPRMLLMVDDPVQNGHYSTSPVSDLDHTIAGLAWFEQICPLQIPFLGHFGALQIVF